MAFITASERKLEQRMLGEAHLVVAERPGRKQPGTDDSPKGIHLMMRRRRKSGLRSRIGTSNLFSWPETRSALGPVLARG